MAFHQFSRLDGAPLLPPPKVRFRWGYLFIFLLVSWWKSTSGYLLCLLVCRVLAAMCEKDEQSLLLLLPPFFLIFVFAFYPFPFGALAKRRRNRTIIPTAAWWPASASRIRSSGVFLSIYLFFSLCVCACVYVLCVHLGVGIISQPKKKKKENRKKEQHGQKRHTNRNPPCTHSAVIYVHTQIYTNTVTW